MARRNLWQIDMGDGSGPSAAWTAASPSTAAPSVRPAACSGPTAASRSSRSAAALPSEGVAADGPLLRFRHGRLGAPGRPAPHPAAPWWPPVPALAGAGLAALVMSALLTYLLATDLGAGAVRRQPDGAGPGCRGGGRPSCSGRAVRRPGPVPHGGRVRGGGAAGGVAGPSRRSPPVEVDQGRPAAVERDHQDQAAPAGHPPCRRHLGLAGRPLAPGQRAGRQPGGLARGLHHSPPRR